MSFQDYAICNVEYREDKGEARILLFLRKRNMDPEVIEIPFEPYFYILKKDRDIFRGSPLVKRFEETTIAPFPKRPDPLVKIVSFLPRFVSTLREFKDSSGKFRIKTWVADVLFPLRYLIDKNIYTGIRYFDDGRIVPIDMPSLYRSFFLDIETLSESSVEPGKDEIIVIGFFDTLTKEYLILCRDFDEDIELQDFLLEKGYISRIIRCSSEKDLLNKFKGFIKSRLPDIIFTFSKFDMECILKRFLALRMPYRDLSRVGIVQLRGQEPKIHGLQIIDIQDLQLFVMLKGSKWETLQDLSMKELGVGRIFHNEEVYQMWNTERWKVIARNLRDVELNRKLVEDRNLFVTLDTIRRTIGAPDFKSCMYRSRISDILHLRLCNEKNIVLESRKIIPKKEREEAKKEYLGGVVKDIIPGIYENIAVFDFKSLYPNIIKAFNISFETYVKNPSDLSKVNNIDNKYFFLKEPKGWTIEILEKLEPLRVYHREKSKDHSLSKKERDFEKALSDGFKSIINALYGIYGKGGSDEEKASRLLHFQIASAIPYVGRILQKEGMEPKASEIGIDLIYMDTDSLMVKLPEGYHLETLQEELSQGAKDFVEARWNVQSSYFVLDLDVVYKTLILISKKRYTGITSDGEKITKGLEEIKRNTAELTEEIQKSISNMIFEKSSREEIIKYVQNLVRDFRNLSLEKISIPQKLSKSLKEYKVQSAHLKAFHFSTDVLKMILDPSKRFYTLYIKSSVTDKKMKRKEIDILVAFDKASNLPESIKQSISWDKMLDLTVKNKIEDFLKILNISWEKDILQEIT